MDDSPHVPVGSDRCWQRVGMSGDRTCPELARVGRCLNCDRYSTTGRRMMEREPPEGYRREWTALLARAKEEEVRGTISLLIFRLGGEWQALPAEVFQEATTVRPIHRIPHRSGDALLGLVNVRGELQLCVSLAGLLGIPRAEGSGPRPGAYERMVVVEREGERWAFVADEVYGVHRFHPSELVNVPATVAKAAGYARGVFRWRDRDVGWLDAEQVFSALLRRAL